MKIRVYESITQPLFCPNCHRRVELPFKGNINIKGKFNITCSHCGKGLIKIEVK